jgi:hypothetical protein
MAMSPPKNAIVLLAMFVLLTAAVRPASAQYTYCDPMNQPYEDILTINRDLNFANPAVSVYVYESGEFGFITTFEQPGLIINQCLQPGSTAIPDLSFGTFVVLNDSEIMIRRYTYDPSLGTVTAMDLSEQNLTDPPGAPQGENPHIPSPALDASGDYHIWFTGSANNVGGVTYTCTDWLGCTVDAFSGAAPTGQELAGPIGQGGYYVANPSVGHHGATDATITAFQSYSSTSGGWDILATCDCVPPDDEPMGSVFTISSGNHDYDPCVAPETFGSDEGAGLDPVTAVTWMRVDYNGLTSHGDIYMAMINPCESAYDEILVAGDVNANETSPAIACFEDGSGVVVWDAGYDCPSLGYALGGTWYRRFEYLGGGAVNWLDCNPVLVDDCAFRTHNGVPGSQVTVDAKGASVNSEDARFVVAWSGCELTVFAKMYLADGTVVGGKTEVPMLNDPCHTGQRSLGRSAQHTTRFMDRSDPSDETTIVVWQTEYLYDLAGQLPYTDHHGEVWYTIVLGFNSPDEIESCFE